MMAERRGGEQQHDLLQRRSARESDRGRYFRDQRPGLAEDVDVRPCVERLDAGKPGLDQRRAASSWPESTPVRPAPPGVSPAFLGRRQHPIRRGKQVKLLRRLAVRLDEAIDARGRQTEDDHAANALIELHADREIGSEMLGDRVSLEIEKDDRAVRGGGQRLERDVRQRSGSASSPGGRRRDSVLLDRIDDVAVHVDEIDVVELRRSDESRRSPRGNGCGHSNIRAPSG